MGILSRYHADQISLCFEMFLHLVFSNLEFIATSFTLIRFSQVLNKEGSIARAALEWNPHPQGKRRRERPMQSWRPTRMVELNENS